MLDVERTQRNHGPNWQPRSKGSPLPQTAHPNKQNDNVVISWLAPSSIHPSCKGMERTKIRSEKNKSQLRLQSRCLPPRRCWLEMRDGRAYRNQTPSSKASYQKTTFRFNDTFHVPLDKTQRKGTSVPALSFSGALLPARRESSLPCLLPFSSSRGVENAPLDLSYVCSRDQHGLDCPLFTSDPSSHPSSEYYLYTHGLSEPSVHPWAAHSHWSSQGTPCSKGPGNGALEARNKDTQHSVPPKKVLLVSHPVAKEVAQRGGPKAM